MKKILPFAMLIAFLIGNPLWAQIKSDGKVFPSDSLLHKSNKENNETPGNYLKKTLEILKGLDISGYYRFITNYRKLNEAYPHLEANKTNIFVGDDSQIPQLMLNIKGQASNNTEFGADLYMWTPLTGAGETENVKGLNLGAYLYGNFTTAAGNFSVKTGGINWYALSPFTFQTSKGNNRYSLFDRNPWDPNMQKIDIRYSQFYSYGKVDQDERWGNQAFQGLILEGNQLPHDFSFSFMYGKTQFDGGLSPIPNTSYGGRIVKNYSDNKIFIAFNTFNNDSQIDPLSNNRAGFNLSTLETTHHVHKFKLYAEIGAGRTFTQTDKNNWGEALSVKISRDIANKFPTELHFYRVSPKVFNNSSIFINSSIQQSLEANPSETQPVLIPVSSAVLPMGQLSNNRQGIEINSLINIGKLKNSIGYANAVELKELSPKITYSHPFNNLALSRFWRWSFPSDVGPYNNLNKIYRAVYETLNLTEIDPVTLAPLKKKYFNTIEISSKYKTSVFNKDLFLFYFGSFNSVQNHASPFVVFSDKALLHTSDHQFETYLKLNSRLVWCNYLGFEKIIANNNTQTDIVSKKPKNQRGISLASGLDIALSKGVVLFIRERWMKYHDINFANDKYRGFETTVELKMFF